MSFDFLTKGRTLRSAHSAVSLGVLILVFAAVVGFFGTQGEQFLDRMQTILLFVVSYAPMAVAISAIWYVWLRYLCNIK